MPTKIEWCHETWNPVRGCSIVSPGCTNCYAMKQAHRFSGPGGAYEGLTKLTKNGGPVWTGKLRFVHEALDMPLRWRRPRRIFVNSMSDLFHEDVPEYFIDYVFAVMALTPRHTFQVLTKRAERMRAYMTDPGLAGKIRAALNSLCAAGLFVGGWIASPKPFEHVWLGVSVEDQERADERIPLLLQTPVAVRWLSCEPLLGPVTLEHERKRGYFPRIQWVVVGGESGPGARPMNPEWAEGLREQCARAGCAFFMKQGSADWPNYKDFDFFPESLKVREYPAAL